MIDYKNIVFTPYDSNNGTLRKDDTYTKTIKNYSGDTNFQIKTATGSIGIYPGSVLKSRYLYQFCQEIMYHYSIRYSLISFNLYDVPLIVTRLECCNNLFSVASSDIFEFLNMLFHCDML